MEHIERRKKRCCISGRVLIHDNVQQTRFLIQFGVQCRLKKDGVQHVFLRSGCIFWVCIDWLSQIRPNQFIFITTIQVQSRYRCRWWWFMWTVSYRSVLGSNYPIENIDQEISTVEPKICTYFICWIDPSHACMHGGNENQILDPH